MKDLPIQIPSEALAAFCRRNGIVRLSLFGSMLHGVCSPTSDADLLVEFEPSARVSLFDIGGMTAELSELHGRQVDLRTPEDLSRYFRSSVLREARPLYMQLECESELGSRGRGARSSSLGRGDRSSGRGLAIAQS